MDNAALNFYPAAGNNTLSPSPLARYLPPLPPGMAAGWLKENVPAGSWLLDPLGASPALALEAARAGYRVLVACNNPILGFMIDTLASAYKSADFQSALAELAMTKRGDERLEVHLKSLYTTECDTCGEMVQAQAFLWRKGETQPFARIYNCAKCGESGERPITQADLDRLSNMGGDRMQRSRALQRVIMDEDEHRADVEEALDTYLARPLYVLFTLLNKLEGLGTSPERTRLLQAMLISTFDAGNTLWPWPGGRSRPKQLIVPPQFRENNLWLALEEAGAEWAYQPAPVPVTQWPAQPPKTGGISLYRGRVKALMPLPEEIGPQAVITVFPRPNQAFWTLSVLWASWLWGAEAALPLRNVLDRRRYDWNWHTSAIHNALAAVGWSLPTKTNFFGLLPELAPGFLSAAVVATEAAGFHLEGLAIQPDSGRAAAFRGDTPRAEQELAQGLWKPSGAGQPGGRDRGTEPIPPGAEELEVAAREAIRADLLARAEPAPYLIEYAAGLAALVQVGAVSRSLSSIPGDLLTRVQAVLARTFADRAFLRLFGGPAEEERGLWWLNGRTPPNGDLPLSDRLEMEVVRFMQKTPAFTFDEVNRLMCAQFPGLLTPPADLIRAIVESYGESIPNPLVAPKQQSFRMRTSELAVARKADLQDMRAALESIGDRLGYTTIERNNLLLWERDNVPHWWYYRMASSIISRYVLTPPPGPAEQCVIVLPSSRARLLSYKLRRDPRLAEMAHGWQFLKFRHLRDIAAEADLTLASWQAQLAEDPIMDEATQMQLFPDLQ